MRALRPVHRCLPLLALNPPTTGSQANHVPPVLPQDVHPVDDQRVPPIESGQQGDQLQRQTVSMSLTFLTMASAMKPLLD